MQGIGEDLIPGQGTMGGQKKFFFKLKKNCPCNDYPIQVPIILLNGSWWFCVFLLLFSHCVVSDSLQPHELQYARPPCPSLSFGVCSNSCPLSRWCHPTISSSVVPFSSCSQSFPASESFPMSQFLHIRWPKYWSCSFSITPSNEYLGLIFSRIAWFDLLSVQGTLKSLLQHHSLVFYNKH